MPDRTAPYPAYNYIVDLKGPGMPSSCSADSRMLAGSTPKSMSPITVTGTKLTRTSERSRARTR